MNPSDPDGISVYMIIPLVGAIRTGHITAASFKTFDGVVLSYSLDEESELEHAYLHTQEKLQSNFHLH